MLPENNNNEDGRKTKSQKIAGIVFGEISA